jgi:translation elongation factor EF-G
MDGAQGSDKAMSGAMYDGFNDWITDAAEKSLLAGDPAAAMNIVKARGFTRDVRALFEPKTAQGTLSPAGQRLSRILDGEKADSGEEVIKALFGSQGSKNAAAGMVSALNSIKGALKQFAPDAAEQTMADLKLAYWTRMVTAKTGEMAGPQQIVSNIKTGQGVKDLLHKIYKEIPGPLSTTQLDLPLARGGEVQALIFDFAYSNHQGVIIFTRLFSGEIKAGDELLLVSVNKKFIVNEVGVMRPDKTKTDKIVAGEIGYIVTGIKEPGITRVGDTVTMAKNPSEAIPGYAEARPLIFASIYPENADDFPLLRQSHQPHLLKYI